MSRNLLSLSFAVSCLGTSVFADAPKVVTDIAPVHSLVARVMEGVGSPTLIVPPEASPHAYTLRPSKAAALQEADVVFWMGEDLTPWMENAIETVAAGARVSTLLDLEDTILHDFREGALFETHDHGHGEGAKGHDDHAHDDHDDHGHDDHGHDDHDDHGHDDHGHDDHAHDDHGHEEAHDDHDHDAHDDHAHAHGDHDPHAWLSPRNAAIWLNVIAAELSALNPENAGTYFANAAEGRAELEALMSEVSALLDPVRGENFVVFHDAYQYFEVDFDFPAAGAISLSDASDPSPARIAEIQARVRDEGISCVLAEPQFNDDLVAAVLEGADAVTAVIDPIGMTLEPGPGLYPNLIRNMAGTLAGCL